MEQNENRYRIINNAPDNPYNQYYQQYLVEPGDEKKEISKGKRIASMVLCAVSNMGLLSFCVYWVVNFYLMGIYGGGNQTVSNSVVFTLSLFAYFMTVFLTTSVVAIVINRKSRWAVINFILIGVVFSTVMLISYIAPSNVARAEDKHSPITSNWKFYSLTSGGKTSEAEDFSEKDIPMIIIYADSTDSRYYKVTYRQNGKNHDADMIVRSAYDRTYKIDYVDSERDMIAKVDEDKLTLTIDGEKGIRIVFVATDEETLIPVDDEEGPDYMKVKMTGKGTVEFTNESDAEYGFSYFYKLEVLKDGKWYYARYEDYLAWNDNGGIYLFPGATITQEYDLSCYGKLSPGEYRLAVGDEDACLYAYFTVNPDGTFSY